MDNFYETHSNQRSLVWRKSIYTFIRVGCKQPVDCCKLLKFWRFVPISQLPIELGCEGLIYTKGVGEVPIVQMATFSVWENVDLLKKYAYNSSEHREAIKKTHQIDWYKEEMFARFVPYKIEGMWNGKPVQNFL